jgi:hypothetical protein
MAAQCPQQTVGVVLVNPIGFQKHKGVRPWWPILGSVWLWENLKPLRRLFLEPFYYRVYQYLGMKADTGHIAAVCLQQMSHVDFEEQQPFIQVRNFKLFFFKRYLFVNGTKFSFRPSTKQREFEP